MTAGPWETHGRETEGSRWTEALPVLVRWTIRRAGYVHGPDPTGRTVDRFFAGRDAALEAARLPFPGVEVSVIEMDPSKPGWPTERVYRRRVRQPRKNKARPA